MSNYSSQMKAWAVDRINQLHANNGSKYTLDDLTEQAQKLAAFTAVPREDLEATAKELFELARNAEPDKASIPALIGTLERIQADRYAQGIDTPSKEETHESA